jgi:tetratricopeptide (TPR) repeat protein
MTGMVILMLGFFFSAQSGFVQKTPDSLLRESDDFYEVGKFDEALTKYEEAEKLDPRSVGSKAILQLVNVNFRLTPPWSTLRNDIAVQQAYQVRAVSALRRMLDRQPENDELLLTYSRLELREGHGKELSSYLDGRLAREPNRAFLIREIMLALVQMGDRARLVEMGDRILRVSKDPEDLYVAAVIDYDAIKRCGEPPQACAAIVAQGETLLRKVIEMRPDYAEAMIYLNLFLKAKAKIISDPAMQKAFIDEGDTLRAKAAELLKSRRGTKQ